MADQLFSDGEIYERLMGRWSRLVGKTFLAWLDAPKNLQWLDVGCGNGAFTEELIAHCAPATVVAIDPSDDQLAYARKLPGAKIADFRVGDAQDLPFADASFDVAIMALVISFLRDPAKAVLEMARVVRPGGWVATYMWDIPGGGTPVDPIYVEMESMGMTSVRPSNPTVSRRETMQELWQKAGLDSVETRVIRIPVLYSDFNDFWDSNAAPIGPQGKLIDEMSAIATLNEKRAILASWASDSCAVEAAPELRMSMSGNVVRWDDIMDALRTLDDEAAGAGKPLPHYKRVLARKSARLLGANPRRREPDGGPPLS